MFQCIIIDISSFISTVLSFCSPIIFLESFGDIRTDRFRRAGADAEAPGLCGLRGHLGSSAEPAA